MTPEERFQENQKLVHFILQKKFPLVAFDEDVIQEANMGLVWDMTNNISVTSYRTRRRHSAELEFTRKVRRIKCNKEYNAYQVISKIHLVGVLC